MKLTSFKTAEELRFCNVCKGKKMSYVMKTFSGNMTIAYAEAVAWIYQLIVYYLRLRKMRKYQR